MISALVKEYFSRDLSPLEDAQLERLLMEDGETADAFFEEAKAGYAALGLKVPERILEPKSRMRVWRWMVPTALAAGLVFGWVGAHLLLPSAPKTSATVKVTDEGGTQALASTRTLGFAPKAQVRPARIEVTLKQRELVVVKVVRQDGQTLKVLQAGTLGAGTYVFQWDERSELGETVPKGQWRVAVEEGIPDGAGR
jgi:hypothetical protein